MAKIFNWAIKRNSRNYTWWIDIQRHTALWENKWVFVNLTNYGDMKFTVERQDEKAIDLQIKQKHYEHSENKFPAKKNFFNLTCLMEYGIAAVKCSSMPKWTISQCRIYIIARRILTRLLKQCYNLKWWKKLVSNVR